MEVWCGFCDPFVVSVFVVHCYLVCVYFYCVVGGYGLCCWPVMTHCSYLSGSAFGFCELVSEYLGWYVWVIWLSC